MNLVEVTMLKNHTIDKVIYKRNRKYRLPADVIDDLASKKIVSASSSANSPTVESKGKKA